MREVVGTAEEHVQAGPKLPEQSWEEEAVGAAERLGRLYLKLQGCIAEREERHMVQVLQRSCIVAAASELRSSPSQKAVAVMADTVGLQELLYRSDSQIRELHGAGFQ